MIEEIVAEFLRMLEGGLQLIEQQNDALAGWLPRLDGFAEGDEVAVERMLRFDAIDRGADRREDGMEEAVRRVVMRVL